MKYLRFFVLIACVLWLLCCVAGCRRGNKFLTAFPLDEAAIRAAMDKTGIPGIISESETVTEDSSEAIYIIRSRTETYEGTEKPLLISRITSSERKGKRTLSVR